MEKDIHVVITMMRIITAEVIEGTKLCQDLRAVVVCSVLAAIYFGSRKIVKSGISPIVLICISAVIGIVVYLLNILTYYGIGNIIGNDSYICKEV